MGSNASTKSVYTGQLAERIAKDLCIPYFRVKQVIDAEIEMMKEILLKGQSVVLKNFIQLQPVVCEEKVYYSRITSNGFVPISNSNDVRIVPKHLTLRLETSDVFRRVLIETDIPKLAVETKTSNRKKGK